MAQQKIPKHTYTVELRFIGDLLNPSDISAQLNLQPRSTLPPDHPLVRKRKPRPCWAYNGQGEIGFQSEWECLDEGLEFLLKSLNSKKAKIITLARQFEGVWWCGHFQTSFDGGPILSPQLLSQLGSYEIPLSIDNYFSNK